jgi:hypothetical protein
MKPANVETADWYRYNALLFMEHWLGYPRFQKYFGKTQKKLFDKVDNYLAGTEPKEILPVEEADNDISDEDFIKQVYEPKMPKVFRGAANEWGAVKKWSLDYFENEYGDKPVLMIDNKGINENQKLESMNMRQFIREIKAGAPKYLQFSNVVNDDETLRNDFDVKWLRKLAAIPASWGDDLKMFIGIKGTLTPLHNGFNPVMFIQVVGQKKWTFYKIQDRMFIDSRTIRAGYFFSDIDPHNINDPKYPLQKYAQRYEITLNPGDVLWFNSFIWHQVENLTPTIGIRYGRSSFHCPWKSSKMLTALILLSTKPSLIERYIYSSPWLKKVMPPY